MERNARHRQEPPPPYDEHPEESLLTTALTPVDLHRFLRTLLAAEATHSRAAVLAQITRSASALPVVGEDGIGTRTVRAIEDAGRWWP